MKSSELNNWPLETRKSPNSNICQLEPVPILFHPVVLSSWQNASEEPQKVGNGAATWLGHEKRRLKKILEFWQNLPLFPFSTGQFQCSFLNFLDPGPWSFPGRMGKVVFK